eukprot:CAMPEP_0178593046 /NCGR_PEP_ID=MMETSP0697-20121206/29718_1 /TAXON_ID=265572 /ORGANISM="Extubocellulus spinifer, Strain CCMP396" /LENGTH=31 /DNA_ID= /DNA_START= /DNA_END= /DNA_ORIENTATION=
MTSMKGQRQEEEAAVAAAEGMADRSGTGATY